MSTNNNTNAYKTVPPVIKSKTIKCVVLGAADAGKTSLLRRYFRQTFSLERVPTAGSDFYTKRVVLERQILVEDNDDEEGNDHDNGEPGPMEHPKGRHLVNSSSNSFGDDLDGFRQPHYNHQRPKTKTIIIQQPILFQMFDTPGKNPERGHRHHKDEQQGEPLMQSLLEAFCKRVHGVMLVYDMTSSTSFTQLRLWFGLWRKQFALHPETRIPILIVGNKRDLIPPQIMVLPPSSSTTTNLDASSSQEKQALKQQHGRQPSTLPVVPVRDVMGVQGSFKGKDFKYEYRVDHSSTLSPPPHTLYACSGAGGGSQPQSQQSLQQHHHHHHHPSKPPRNMHHKSSSKNRHEISTFVSTAAGMWTQDGSYLDSLLGTEDRSNPDRDMVKLWCMRNDLVHVEVSAALADDAASNTTATAKDNSGNVTHAMHTLLDLILDHQQQQEQEQQEVERQQQLRQQQLQAQRQQQLQAQQQQQHEKETNRHRQQQAMANAYEDAFQQQKQELQHQLQQENQQQQELQQLLQQSVEVSVEEDSPGSHDEGNSAAPPQEDDHQNQPSESEPLLPATSTTTPDESTAALSTTSEPPQSEQESPTNNNPTQTNNNLLQLDKNKNIAFVLPNKELDLLERYRPKDYKCCFGFCPSWSALLGVPPILRPSPSITTQEES